MRHYTAFLGRLAVLVAIPLVTLNLMAWMQMPDDAYWRSLYAEAGVINGIALYALLAPSQSISWLPLALAGAAAWSLRARPGNVVGLSCAAAVLMGVVLAVGEPLANRTFGEWARAIQPLDQAGVTWSAPADPTSLATRVIERWRASDVVTTAWFVVFEVAPIPLAASLVLMAGIAARASSRRYWLWLCATPVVWFGGIALWQVAYRMPGEYWRPYLFWLCALAPWLLAFALLAWIVRTQTLVRT